MNRNDRSKIMMRTREFLEVLLAECDSYSSFLDDVASNEEEKLDNLPDGFSGSSLSDKLETDYESITAANEMVKEILSVADEIPDTLNIQIRKARLREANERCTAKRTSASVSTNEKRTERLQVVLTPTLANALKHESAYREISMNEMINQMLKRELSSNSTINTCDCS